jgi:N-glycosylase/DNA lyase
MITEELNEYVFASMVMKSAWSIRCRRVNALEDAGEITAEQAKDMSQTVADVREALKVIRHNKKVVLDILAELESAPADSPVPTQDES